MAIEQIEVVTPRGTFAARAAGATGAPVVLCLHGFPDDATTFDALVARLAEIGLRAVAPYCRGYAPSPLRNPDGSRFGKDLFAVLAADVLAIADALSPDAPVRVVGHDNGAFTVYHALNLAPDRFTRAVTLSAAHPAVVYKNTSRTPRQLWRSRYAIFFQIPGFSEAAVQRDNYAYITELWRRWAAPGWQLPSEHLAGVKQTLERSMPAPILQYRSGAFEAGSGWRPISVPTLYLIGAQDGCVLPAMSRGQERQFSNEFRSETIADAGHFLHQEQPEVVATAIIDWLQAGAGVDA